MSESTFRLPDNFAIGSQTMSDVHVAWNAGQALGARQSKGVAKWQLW